MRETQTRCHLTPEIIDKWSHDPLAWVIECEGCTPTTQQRAYWTALRDLVHAKLKLQAGYFEPWIKNPGRYSARQRAAFEAEYMLAKKIGISVMSGKGTGKTAVAAQTVRWFMRFFVRGRVAITGPSYDQVRDCLWQEIQKWNGMRDDHGDYTSMIRDYFDIKTDSITLKTEAGKPETETAYARIRTAPQNADRDAQAETLAGWHEDNMMIMIDEASKVPEPVFKAFDSTITRPMNFVVMIFNPTRNTGYAYETHFGARAPNWVQLHWPSTQSEIVSPEFIQTYRNEYGEESAEYKMYIEGLPPEDTADSLIPYSKITDAVGRELNPDADDPLIMGVDPARLGKDKSAIVTRRGPTVVDVEEYTGLKTDELTEAILEKIFEMEDTHRVQVTAVYVETTGVGAGVYDQLVKQFRRTYAVDVNSNAKRKDRFCRLRDELWCMLADRFKNNSISLPNNPRLVNELGAIRLDDPDQKGRVKVENKKKMRERGVPSPNLGDALMVTMYASDRAMRMAARSRKETRIARSKDPRRQDIKNAWMVL